MDTVPLATLSSYSYNVHFSCEATLVATVVDNYQQLYNHYMCCLKNQWLAKVYHSKDICMQ